MFPIIDGMSTHDVQRSSGGRRGPLLLCSNLDFSVYRVVLTSESRDYIMFKTN